MSSKHIYIYSPSSAVRDKAAFRRGVARLKALGHEVELDSAALASHMRFAGDDATRLAAIERAAASGADVALISRGGYGLTRLLPQIRYRAVARAIERGTQFVGLSDFTAFQNAVLAQTGAVTWAGPALGEDFGGQVEADGSPDAIMEACFDDLLHGQGEGAGWRLPAPRKPRTATHSVASDQEPARAKIDSSTQKWQKEGLLWGGNLSVLVSLIGTPWLPVVEGGVLFLEDVGEHPYRIERMLTQLLHSGLLARQQAVLLGQFTQYKLVPGHDKGFKLDTVAAWLQAQLAGRPGRRSTRVPVLGGLPFGHVPTKVLLPVGAPVTLAVEGRDALLFWGHAEGSSHHTPHAG